MNSVPKNFGKGTDAFVPSSINLKSVLITNHKGESFNIAPIVSDFSITESIYSTSLIVSITVVDANNTIENIQIIGQEKISFVITRNKHEDGEEEDIELDLTVTDIPKYSRSDNEYVQSYVISAVASFAVVDKTLKISRSYNNNTIDEIKKILNTDLSVTDLEELGSGISRSRGLLRWQHPLQAVEHFRKNSFNDVGSPFYVFQRLTGQVVIAAQSDLVAEEVYETYFDGKQFTGKALTKDDYIQRRTRIISCDSNLKFGKTFNSVAGAYASENNYLDYGNKTYTKLDFTYNDFPLGNTLNQNSSLSTTAEIDYSTTFQAHCEYISTNEFAFEGATKNNNNLRKENGHVVKSFSENLDATTHDVELFGDSFLNAGRVIELKFPKSQDPLTRDTSQAEKYDDNLSGKYLIISAVHTSKDGEYFTNVRVKKDSMSVTL